MITDILLSIVTMAFALVVVFSKKTVVSALALLMTLLCIALIYFQLDAVFLAAIQVLINAGAVAILFVFVMMLINLEQFENNKEQKPFKIILALAITIGSFIIVGLTINNNIETLAVNNISDNSMYLLFDRLFTTYYLPFEIASVLLLAAMVACIAITNTSKLVRKEEENSNE